MSNDTKDGKPQGPNATGWLALHDIAAPRGDGLIPGFSDLLARAGAAEASPRLVVSNDEIPRNRHRAGKTLRRARRLVLVTDTASRSKLG